jgi:hypothetical protein
VWLGVEGAGMVSRGRGGRIVISRLAELAADGDESEEKIMIGTNTDVEYKVTFLRAFGTRRFTSGIWNVVVG